MSVHEVKVQLPPLKVLNEKASFEVKSNGRAFGVLTVNQGGVRWVPRGGKKERHLNWEEFDRLVSNAKG